MSATTPRGKAKARVKRSKRAILALDGGGVRGIVTAGVLAVLEDELRKQSGVPDLVIAEAFDVISGTSTGSVLATYLTSFGLRGFKGHGTLQQELDGSVAKALEMYKRMGPKIFPKSRWPFTGLFRTARYPATGLESQLNEAFDPSMTLSKYATADDGGRPCASLFVVAYDLVYARPVAFVADRERKKTAFLRLDPFSMPFSPSLLVHQDPRKALLEARYANLPPQARTVFAPGALSLFNVGDADVPVILQETAGAPGAPPAEEHGGTQKVVWDTDPDLPVAQAVRCSAAAPTYLPPARVRDFYRDPRTGKRADLVAVDGAVAANNPALHALTYLATHDLARKRTSSLAPYAVLSIGTGVTYGLPEGEAASKIDSLMDWLTASPNIIDVLMANGPMLAHHTLDVLFSTLSNKYGPAFARQYLRVQVAVDTNAQPGESGYTPESIRKALSTLDDTSPEAMAELEKIGNALGELYRPVIAQFVKDNLLK